MKKYFSVSLKYFKYLVLIIAAFISCGTVYNIGYVNFYAGAKNIAGRIKNGDAAKIMLQYAGMEGLPRPVMIACEGIREMKIPDYTCVGLMRRDFLYSQRIMEGAWPVKASIESKYVVGFAKDVRYELDVKEKKYEMAWEKEGIGIAVIKN